MIVLRRTRCRIYLSCLSFMVLASAGSSAAAGAFEVEYLKRCDLDLCLKALTFESAKQLPQMIDRDTRWDSIYSIGRTIGLNYTIVTAPSDEFDVHALLDELRPIVERSTCSNPGSHALIDRGVSYRFRYSDGKGTFLREFEVNAAACAARKKNDFLENPEGMQGA